MKLRVIQNFRDKDARRERAEGDVFTASKERYEDLHGRGLVEEVTEEPVQEPLTESTAEEVTEQTTEPVAEVITDAEPVAVPAKKGNKKAATRQTKEEKNTGEDK